MNILEDYKQTRQKLFDAAGIQPQSKIVSTNGAIKNVHYLEAGSGKPLIIIHGGGGHASHWINIMKPLAENYHLYVPDRPGCGLSDTINYHGLDYMKNAAEFVRSFMDAVGLKQALVMGNSMGGYFSICFALQYPERVEKLLLIGAPAGMNLYIPFMLRLLSIRGLNSFMMNMTKPSIKNTYNIFQMINVADASKLSVDYLQHDVHSQLIPGTRKSFLSLLESVLTLSGFKKDLYIGDKLIQLKMPVRFLWGDKDVFETPESGLKKASIISDYKFEVVENAAHMPWFDQQEKCSELIIKLLKE